MGTQEYTPKQAERIASEATRIVELACGPERPSTQEQLDAVGIDGDVIDAAVKATLLYAEGAKGLEGIAALTLNPGLTMMLGVSLAATYLANKS